MISCEASRQVRGIARVPRHSAQKEKSLLQELGRPYVFLANMEIQRAWFYEILVLIIVVEICRTHKCPSSFKQFSYMEKLSFLNPASSVHKSELKLPASLVAVYKHAIFPMWDLDLEVRNVSKVNITEVHQYSGSPFFLSASRTALPLSLDVRYGHEIFDQCNVSRRECMFFLTLSATANYEGS